MAFPAVSRESPVRHNRNAARMLEATPPNGRELALVLRRLMTREQVLAYL